MPTTILSNQTFYLHHHDPSGAIAYPTQPPRQETLIGGIYSK
jgi:hypothetical protein